MTTRRSTKLITLAMCAVLSACAGKRVEVENVEPVADITRPPQMVSAKPNVAVEESNPDETISYDEWRKRREAELKGNDP